MSVALLGCGRGSGTGSGGAGTNTTWNSADKSAGVALSGSDLIYTGSGGARSTTSLSTGKAYWEILINQASGDTAWNIGITDSGTAFATYVANGFIMFVFLGSGSASNGGNGPGSAVANGDIVCIAADFGAKKIWFRKNGGNWNNNGSADPATAVSPNTFAASGPYYAAGGSNQAGTSYTANFGASAFSFTVPSGFASWNSLV